MTAISCSSVVVSFDGVEVLKGIDIHVPSGGWVTIVGPNGAGKSTLLRAVAGLLPARGDVSLGGRAVASMGRRELARLVALVPQEPVIPPGMPVLDYVLLGRTAHLGFFAAETTSDVSLALEALSDLDAGHLAGRTVDTLSGGERQRVVIARALAQGLNTELIRLQCYEGLDIGHAVYEWNHTRQLLEIRLMEAGGDVDRQSAAKDLFDERFLIKRPLLQAIDESREGPPVLLIDELDRADEEFEGFLLELLGDFQITIPELGTFRAVHPPIVVITSNRTREIHDALKRRCLYYWVDYPDYQKELQIVTSRLPDAPRRLAEQVTGFIQELRETELFKIPGVSETLDWTAALLALNQTTLDPQVIEDTLGIMLKYQDDIEQVRGEPIQALLERSQNRGPRRGGRGGGS